MTAFHLVTTMVLATLFSVIMVLAGAVSRTAGQPSTTISSMNIQPNKSVMYYGLNATRHMNGSYNGTMMLRNTQGPAYSGPENSKTVAHSTASQKDAITKYSVGPGGAMTKSPSESSGRASKSSGGAGGPVNKSSGRAGGPATASQSSGGAGGPLSRGVSGSGGSYARPTPTMSGNKGKPASSGAAGKNTIGPKPTPGPQPTTEKSKTKSEATKEKQKEQQGKVAERNPKVKEGLDALSKATTKKEVLDALKKASEAAKKNLEQQSDYEKRSVALTVYKSTQKKNIGSQETVVELLGELALSLDIKEYKTMDIVSLMQVIKIGNKAIESFSDVKLSPPAQDIILTRIVKLMPKQNFTENFGRQLRPLKDVLPEHKTLRDLPIAVIRGILSFVKDTKTNCEGKTPLIISLYLRNADISLFATEILPRFGEALCYLTPALLKKIPKSIIKTENHVHHLCRPRWNKGQVQVVVSLATSQDAFKDLTKLSCDQIRQFRNCWAGVSPKVFRQVPVTAADIECFNTTRLPPNLQNELAKKIKAATGSLKQLTPSKIKTVIAAAGVSAKQMKELNVTVLKEVSEEIEKKIKENVINNRVAVKVAAKLILKAKVNDASFKLSKLPAKLLTQLPLSNVKDIPVEKLGFSENDTTTPTSSEEEDTEVVSLSLSNAIISKLKVRYGGFNASLSYWRKVLTRTRKFCCGFLARDVEEMPKDLVRDFVSVCKNTGYRCSSLASAVGKRYEELIKEEGSEVLTETDLNVVGKFLPGISLTLLLKMTDDADTRKYAIELIRSSCSEKIYTKKRLETLAEMALAMLKINSGKEINSVTIDTLGCLVGDLRKEIVKDIPEDVVVDRAEVMGQYEFEDESRKEFLKKIKTKHAKNNDLSGALSFINATDFQKYSRLIIKALDAVDISKIPQEVLKENIYAIASSDITQSVAAAVNAKVPNINADAARRKRRSTDNQNLGNKTAADINQMGSLMYGLSPAAIQTINDEVFKEALDTIGNLGGFTEDQLKAWVVVLKRAYGSVSFISDSDLKRLKYLILGMEASDMNSLTLNSTEVISVFSGISGYNTSQIEAMYSEIKEDLKRSSVEHFTGEELSASRHFLRASVHSNLEKLPVTPYKEASKDLGEVDGWTENHLVALKKLAVNAYGNVSTWGASELREVGAAIGGLTTAEIKLISPSNFAVVKAVAIKQIPVNLFKKLSIDQIKSMTSVQFAAVQEIQKASLTTEQRNAFDEASGANQTVNTSSLFTNENKVPDQKATVSSRSTASWGSTVKISATASIQTTPVLTSSGSNVTINSTASPSPNVVGVCNEWQGTCNGGDYTVPASINLFITLIVSAGLMTSLFR